MRCLDFFFPFVPCLCVDLFFGGKAYFLQVEVRFEHPLHTLRLLGRKHYCLSRRHEASISYYWSNPYFSCCAYLKLKRDDVKVVLAPL